MRVDQTKALVMTERLLMNVHSLGRDPYGKAQA
jgi:hypothetical protein